jgi:tRNA G18 (ribose-2'-O)-methylase SpoU
VALDRVIAGRESRVLLAAVDSLSSAENMGAVVRNCAGLRADALIVGETCSSPYLRRAVRSSMGTVFQLPVLETPNLAATLQGLRRQGIRCVATTPHVKGRPLFQTDLVQGCCLVFGSEGYGISETVLAACDEIAAVPMPPAIDSLNVASAAAIFLYEANRQRQSF